MLEEGILTLVNDEFFTCEYYWDGISRFYYGANGVPLGFVEVGFDTPSGTLAVSFGIQTGEAAAKTADFDYIFAARERTGVTES